MAKRNVRGFTLIELVIVIAVIAILAALLVPTILGQAERARASRARSDVANLGKAVARVRTDTGNSTLGCLTDLTLNLPAADAATAAACGPLLTSCTTATPGYICWGGPYIPIVSNDPWNNPYTATVDTTTFAVTIFSRGPDGTSSSDDITFVQ
jgi:general secretion pathway protein G